MAATLAQLLLLSAVPLATAETVLGAYIFHRHGDRTTKSYKPTVLTSLGAEQVYISGQYYRDQYISSNAPAKINGVSSDLVVLSQLEVTAPTDDVLQNSAQVFLQGLYPPTTLATQTLANGTKVNAPLGGYQYIPVNSVSTAASSSDSENSEWLQAGSGCGNAVVSSNNYFSSQEYLSTLASTKDFYSSLLPVINTTFSADKATFKNAYTVYDYVHVSQIHNASIPASNLLTKETVHQMQTLADKHEFGLAYNSSEPVRAIAGSTLAGQVLTFLNSTALSAPSTPKLEIQFGAYATFLAFFGLASLPKVSENFTGIVDYASSIVFELVTNSTSAKPATSDLSVRFRFANGTASEENPAQEYPLFGQDQTVLGWNDFVKGMQQFAIADTASWCKICGNSTGVCADALAQDGDNGTSGSDPVATTGQSSGMSRAVAGVIGALVTLAVILGLEALVMGLGGLRVVKKAALRRTAVEEAAPTKAQ
jgi:hypothetical protein